MSDGAIVAYSPINVHGYQVDAIWCDEAPDAMTPEKARAHAWAMVDDGDAVSVVVLRATPDTRPVDGAA